MARISQQAKEGLNVAVTIGVGLATGFFVEAHVKHEDTTFSVIALLFFAIAQLVLALVPSQDMRDLEEYRKGEMTSLMVKNAMSAQALKLAEEGKLDEAIEWQEASAGLKAQGQKKK